MGSQKEDNFINKSIGILRIVPAIAGLYYFLCSSLHLDAFVIYTGFIKSRKLYFLSLMCMQMVGTVRSILITRRKVSRRSKEGNNCRICLMCICCSESGIGQESVKNSLYPVTFHS